MIAFSPLSHTAANLPSDIDVHFVSVKEKGRATFSRGREEKELRCLGFYSILRGMWLMIESLKILQGGNALMLESKQRLCCV